MGNQVELRIDFPNHMVEKNIWWSDVVRISGHFGNLNWRYLPSVRYKVYASFVTASNEYVRWCWSLFPCRPAEVRCEASCVAQLFAKRPDAFLQLVGVFDALKGLEGLLDSPVEVLLFPPLSPPFQLGLLHQWITRHDTPHEKSQTNCWFTRLASSSNGGSLYPRGQTAENRRGQGTLQPFFGENRMSWKGKGSGSVSGRAAYPLVMTNSLPWKITMLLMGKSTISMVIFNSYVSLPEGRWC